MTRFSLNHRWVVVALWAVLLALGGASAPGLSKTLSTTFSLPNQPAYRANTVLARAYGGGGAAPPLVLTVALPRGMTVYGTKVRGDLARGFAAVEHGRRGGRLRRPIPVHVVDWLDTHDARFVSSHGTFTFALVDIPPLGFGIPDPSAAVQAAFTKVARLPAGTVVGTTGIQQLTLNGSKSSGTGVLAETLLGGVGALFVLAFVFGSFVAVVPMVMAAVSILTTFAAITALTHITSVSFIVQFLVALIGLGVAIDYSLLVITRWREERNAGRSNTDAVDVAMRTAGTAVAFSGITVAVGLFALVFLPVPFLRSVGYGGVLIPFVSVAVALTLLPVLLASIGPFIDRPRLRTSVTASRPWLAWGRLVIRHRVLAALAAVAVLAALVVPAATIQVGDPGTSSLAKSGTAYAGLRQLQLHHVPLGVLDPIQVLVPASAPRTAVRTVVEATSRLPGVYTAIAAGAVPRAGEVDVLPYDETNAGSGAALVGQVRRALQPVPGAVVAGFGAESQAFNTAVYGTFPYMLAAILSLTFVLLAWAFRSAVLALKAVLLNLVSVTATYGVMVLVWQDGFGSKILWGIPATGAITNFIPLMVFAFLFGLSMDYEVFILARIREEYDRTHSTDEAVVEGIGRTGRLVTSAALILFLSFLSLSQAPNVDIKVFATGLGAGILLDATVVRALLVPALVSLLGKSNWWWFHSRSSVTSVGQGRAG